MVDMKELANSLDEAYGFSKASAENDAPRSRTANATTASSFRYNSTACTANDQRTSFSTKRTHEAPITTARNFDGGKWKSSRYFPTLIHFMTVLYTKWRFSKRLEDHIERHEAVHEEEEISLVHTPTGTAQGDTPTPTSLIHPSGSGKLQHFQKRREKSARILITIVLAFLFCHTFRFVIEAYEVTHPSHSTYEHHTFCLNNKKWERYYRYCRDTLRNLLSGFMSPWFFSYYKVSVTFCSWSILRSTLSFTAVWVRGSVQSSKDLSFPYA